MYTFLFVMLSVLFAAVAWQDRHRAVLLILAALPSYLLRLTVGGIPVTFLETMILVTAAIWIIRDHGLKSLKTLPRSWNIILVLFLITATISAFAAPSLQTAFGIWKAYMIEPVIFFLLARDLLNTADLRQKAILFLVVGATFVSLFAVVQRVFGIGIPEPWDVEGRATSIFPYPNAVGLYVGPILVLAAGSLVKRIEMKQIASAIGYAVAIVLGAAALVFSQTEAAWVAAPVAIFAALAFFKNTRLVAAGLAVVSVAIILAVAPLRSAVFEKLTLQDYSGQVRIAQWEETVSMLKDNWLLGAGLSGYPAALAPYHTHPENEIFQYPHNILLNAWTEFGALGLVFLALLASGVLRTLGRSAKHRAEEFPLVVFSAAALLEMFIHGLVDAPYFKNDLSVLTWGILALFLLAANRAYAPQTAR